MYVWSVTGLYLIVAPSNRREIDRVGAGHPWTIYRIIR